MAGTHRTKWTRFRVQLARSLGTAAPAARQRGVPMVQRRRGSTREGLAAGEADLPAELVPRTEVAGAAAAGGRLARVLVHCTVRSSMNINHNHNHNSLKINDYT